jgi:pyruvate,orthophosphate dikinase
MSPTIYHFGPNTTEGDQSLRPLLGNKGVGLVEMARHGFLVPPGFIIPTTVCREYYKNNKTLSSEFFKQIDSEILLLEKVRGRKFGSPTDPLLLSIRSGAEQSMPGMMDTILDLGLNEFVVKALEIRSGNPLFAWGSYRRFILMYATIVLKIDGLETNVPDTDLVAIKKTIEDYKHEVRIKTGRHFPDDPYEQLHGAIKAVLDSWTTERAILYRNNYNLDPDAGTAIVVQAMVFGNLNSHSAVGVCFTRNPATGAPGLYGEYLINAQGEDVVDGTKTPIEIEEMESDPTFNPIHRALVYTGARLEEYFGDMQDFEFVVEDLRLYILQTRTGKRTAEASIRIAYDMVWNNAMSKQVAASYITDKLVEQLSAPIFQPDDELNAVTHFFLTQGLPAGLGAATGIVCFDSVRAEQLASEGKKVILCRTETSTHDLRGMLAAVGILTARGGASSHAALVARQMNKPCVVGAGDLEINYSEKLLVANGGWVLREGDSISINGTTGMVYRSSIGLSSSEFKQILVDKTMKPEQSLLFQRYQYLLSLKQYVDERTQCLIP